MVGKIVDVIIVGMEKIPKIKHEKENEGKNYPKKAQLTI